MSPAIASHADAERQHRRDLGSGMLRAGVFGMSDGLVSNLALVMGVAGGSGEARTVVLAGTAGLLAGAFSMAAGEYVSMATQRESMQRQLEVEREHIERYPNEEKRQLTQLLEEGGLAPGVAGDLARRIHQRTEPAVDFHALHELGIVPGQMGSPIAASLVSFAAFALGAAVPLAPWLGLADPFAPSLIASGLALLAVGGAVTRWTNRGVIAGALRQLAFGGAAAGLTWMVGRLIGTAV